MEERNLRETPFSLNILCIYLKIQIYIYRRWQPSQRPHALVNTSVNQPDSIDNQILRILQGHDTSVNAPVKRQIEIVKLLKEQKLNRKQLMDVIGATEDQIRRDIEKLKDYIEFDGAPKIGGYILRETIKKKLK